MPAYLIKHLLRASAMSEDSYSPEGWSPKLAVVLRGPAPEGQLSWRMSRPDGSDWFETAEDVPELENGEAHEVRLRPPGSGTDIDQAGDCRFTLALVNELDGYDQTLHDGVLRAVKVDDGDHLYRVDSDWFLSLGLIALDTDDERDAPMLRVTVFLGGDVDAYQLEAHLFRDGKRFAKASDSDSPFTFERNDSETLGVAASFEFDEVRGWNNLAGEGWGDDGWHLLDANPGHYEVKVTRDRKVVRIVPFDVGADGRIVKTGTIEPDGDGRPAMWQPAEVVGATDGPFDTGALASRPSYGDRVTAALDWSADDMYRDRVDGAASGSADAAEFDEETEEAITAVADRATTLLSLWEQDMERGLDPDEAPSFQSNFLLQCETVVDDVGTFEAMRTAIEAVPDERPIEVLGDDTTLGETVARVLRLRDLARSHLAQASQEQEDSLTPFRDVLANDKLRIFEDHPADSFRYHAPHRHVIETPDELADAEYWFFEGAVDLKGKADVEGTTVAVTVQGWRVLGYKFDGDGNLVDENESQGQGPSAPKGAFAPF